MTIYEIKKQVRQAAEKALTKMQIYYDENTHSMHKRDGDTDEEIIAELTFDLLHDAANSIRR